MKDPTKHNILICTADFPPKRGGIASYSFEIANALQTNTAAHITVLAPRSKEKETGAQKYFTLHEIWLPKNSLFAALLFSFHISFYLLTHSNSSILCTNWLPAGLASVLSPIRAWKKTPVFLVAHGGEYLSKKPAAFAFIKRQLCKLSLKKATQIFAVSQFTKNLVCEYGKCDPARIQVIPNGVNLDKFFPLERPANDIFCILSICRLEPHKNIDIVLYALAEIKSKAYRFIYKVVGTGKELEKLKDLSHSLGLEQNILFLGDIPDSELNQTIGACDIFVLLSGAKPQTGNIEGFGLVFLEAAACGKTSVGTRSGGIPDAVIDGKTGLLVPEGNSKEAAIAILSLMENTDKRNTLAKNALVRVENELNWKNVAIKMYAELSKGQ